MMKNEFSTVVALSFLLSVSGCAEHEHTTEISKHQNVTTPSGIQQKAIFQKLVSELIDAIDKDDMHNRSNKIWKIYERELFVELCGVREKLRMLLKINATFSRMKSSFSQKSQLEYASIKKQLIGDLRELQKISELYVSTENRYGGRLDYRDKVISLLETIYESYLMKFVYANKQMLMDAWFDFICNSNGSADRIPAGLSVAVVNHKTRRKNDEFGYEFLVFSLKNSGCKIVIFIEEREVISHIFLYDPKDKQKLQRINVNVKKYPSYCYCSSPFEFNVEPSLMKDFNQNEIHLWAGNAENIVFDNENNIFLIGDKKYDGGEYAFDYKLDLKNKTVKLVQGRATKK
jgi:hypothetical protein